MENKKTDLWNFEFKLICALIFVVCFGAKADEVKKESPKSPVEASGFMEGIEDLIRRADLPAIFEKDFERQNIGGNAYWERRMEPAFRQGNTTLVDDYGLELTLHPKALQLVRGDWVFGPSASGLVRFQFARQFPGNRLKDLTKIAVSPIHSPFGELPLTAERAKKLDIGEFFSFQAHLNLVISGSQLTNSVKGLHIFPDAHYLMSGEFQVHLYRIDENLFDLKLIGIRDKNIGGGAKLGFQRESDSSIVRIEFADKILKRRLKFTPFELNFELPKSNLYMVHYKLNFADGNEDVKAAYDSLFDSLWNWRTLTILDPRNSAQELKDILLADISPIEDIFEKEKDKSVDARKVDRVFRGENDVVDANGMSVALGHNDILRWSHNQNYAENFMTVTNREGEKKYFYMPMFTIFDSSRGLLGLWDESALRTANLLFESDENQKIDAYGEMSFSLEYRDKKFRTSEIRKLKNFIKSRIPDEFYQEIDWKGWVDESDKTNARVTMKLVFRPKALSFASDMHRGHIWTRLVEYLRSLPEIQAVPRDFAGQNRSQMRDPADKYYEDIDFGSYKLEQTFNSQLSTVERTMAFIELRSNPLFQEVGSGFLAHLLAARARELHGAAGIRDVLQNSYFETTWEAKNMDTVHLIKGDCQKRPLYNAVMYIYSLLHNRSMDMRLVQNEEGPGLPGKVDDPNCR